jgi:tetratricopeptide (TPR) repeat protein
MQPTQSNQPLQQALALVRQGQYQQAITVLRKFVKFYPRNFQAYNLLGLALHYQGDEGLGMKAFQQSIQINPNDPGALIHLGGLCAQRNRQERAVKYYLKALKLQPHLPEVQYNLSIAYHKMGDNQRAIRHLENLLKTQPNHSAALSTLGLIYQAEKDDQKALTYYNRCLSVDPGSVIALHNKAIILRCRKQFKEAIKLSQAAIKIRPQVADIHQNLGSCYSAMGEVKQAVSSFEKAIKLEPMNVSHHHWLNELLWKEGKSEFLNSYHHVLGSAPESHHLRRELVYKLTLADRIEEAGEHSKYLMDKDPANPSNPKLHGVVLRKQHRFEEAVTAHQKAVQLDPENPGCQEELATSYLGCGDSIAALGVLNKLILQDKLHQGYIALKATALRMSGSDEYYDLCNYEKLVLKTIIELPPGYTSLTEFNQELADYLSGMHINQGHPLDQSLVHGTQTIDDLFENPDRLISLLKSAFDEQMLCFLKQLPVDPSHPTLSRNNHQFNCTGAWSVKLRRSGFHRNHFHTHGWYSGPYYVELPGVMDNESEKQGWIKLGEPGIDTIAPMAADLVIKPETGVMIRFPSFMWHGTIPFDSDQSRLVVTLDLDPN